MAKYEETQEVFPGSLEKMEILQKSSKNLLTLIWPGDII